MSTIAFAQFDDVSACLAVDTAASRSGVELSKLFAIPALNAVVAGRGRPMVLGTVMLRLSLAQSFEEAAADLPAALVAAVAAQGAMDAEAARTLGVNVADARKQAGVVGEGAEHHVVLLVGRLRCGNLCATTAELTPAGDMHTMASVGCYFGPPPDAKYIDAANLLLRTDDGVRAMLRAQVGSQGGAPGFGGRAIVARLTGGSQPSVLVKDLGPIA